MLCMHPHLLMLLQKRYHEETVHLTMLCSVGFFATFGGVFGLISAYIHLLWNELGKNTKRANLCLKSFGEEGAMYRGKQSA